MSSKHLVESSQYVRKELAKKKKKKKRSINVCGYKS